MTPKQGTRAFFLYSFHAVSRVKEGQEGSVLSVLLTLFSFIMDPVFRHQCIFIPTDSMTYFAALSLLSERILLSYLTSFSSPLSFHQSFNSSYDGIYFG